MSISSNGSPRPASHRPEDTLTVVPGRAKPIQGVVHLALMATFLFFSLVP